MFFFIFQKNLCNVKIIVGIRERMSKLQTKLFGRIGLIYCKYLFRRPPAIQSSLSILFHDILPSFMMAEKYL